jgi:hypothetical protein
MRLTGIIAHATQNTGYLTPAGSPRAGRTTAAAAVPGPAYPAGQAR